MKVWTDLVKNNPVKYFKDSIFLPEVDFKSNFDKVVDKFKQNDLKELMEQCIYILKSAKGVHATHFRRWTDSPPQPQPQGPRQAQEAQYNGQHHARTRRPRKTGKPRTLPQIPQWQSQQTQGTQLRKAQKGTGDRDRRVRQGAVPEQLRLQKV